MYAFPTVFPKPLQAFIIDRIPKSLRDGHPDLVSQCLEELRRTYIFSMKTTWYQMHAVPQSSERKEKASQIKSFAVAPNYVRTRAILQDQTFLDSKTVQVTLREALALLQGILGFSPHRIESSMGAPRLKSHKAYDTTTQLLDQIHVDPTTFMTVMNQNKTHFSSDMILNVFFHKDLQFPMVFEDFVQSVSAHVELVETRLGVEWPMQVTLLVEEWLESYFNLQKLIARMLKKDIEQITGMHETDTTEKRQGPKQKAKEFLLLLDFMLEDQVKQVILMGMRLYLKLWGFHLEYERGTLQRITAPLTLPLLFIIHLEINKKKEYLYQPCLTKVQEDILRCFEMPINSTKSIPRVDTIIFSGAREIRTNWKIVMKEGVKFLNTSCADIEKLKLMGSDVLLAVLHRTFPQIEAITALFEPFRFLLDEDPLKVPEFKKPETPVSWYERVLERYAKAKFDIENCTLDVVEIAPIGVNTGRIKSQLRERADAVVRATLDHLELRLNQTCTKLKSEYQQLFTSILIDPKTIVLIKELEKNLDSVPTFLEAFRKRFQIVQETYELSLTINLPFQDKSVQLYWECFGFPAKLRDQVPRSKRRLEDGCQRLQQLIDIDKQYMAETLTAYLHEMNIFYNTESSTAHIRFMPMKLKSLRDRTTKLQKLYHSIEERETLLRGTFTAHKQFQLFVEDLGSLEVQWQVFEKYTESLNRWLQEYYANVDPESIRSLMTKFISSLDKILVRSLRHSPLLERNVSNLYTQLQKFQKLSSPLLQLRGFAVKQRDWEDLAEALNMNSDDLVKTKLRDLLRTDPDLLENAILHFS